jgi:hypothetical protein
VAFFDIKMGFFDIKMGFLRRNLAFLRKFDRKTCIFDGKMSKKWIFRGNFNIKSGIFNQNFFFINLNIKKN